MLFVLAGPSYVGKKTALSHFMKLYSFSSIIPYTTKPVKRQSGEVEGIKYHYVDQDNATDIDNDAFIHDRPFRYKNNDDQIIYAYKKSDIEQAINSYSNFIIHASVGNAINISKEYRAKNKGHLYIIFLDYSEALTEEFFRKRFIKMDSQYQNGSDPENNIDEEQFRRRFAHAKKERSVYSKNTKYFDEEIKGDQPYSICSSLENYILPKLMVMPTSPDRIPGPLSDDDIMYMIEKRLKDKLLIKHKENTLSASESKKILSGCAIQLSLSSTIRIIKRPLINNYIDMAQDECLLDSKLSGIYKEKNISLGYVLKPDETILCSSVESITMPHDIYGLVSSKFSYTQLGLSIELGTSVIQPGHEGKIHFQIKNNTANSICIYPEIQVAQLLLFRTVQPSSAKYCDKTGTHAYDKESVSPISKFRDDNKELANAKKPGKNFIKSVAGAFRNQMVEAIVGILFTCGIIVTVATKAEAFLKTYIIPIFNSSPILIKVMLIAIGIWLFSHLFDFIGRLLISFVEFVIRKIRERIR